MTTDVTVLGVGGAKVTIPISTGANAMLAQAALDPLSALISAGQLYLYNDSIAGNATIPVENGSISGVEVTIPGLINIETLSSNNKLLYVAGGNNTVTAIGSLDPTVVAGAGSDLVYVNNAAYAEIYLGGGSNFITQNSPTVSALINVDGSDTFGVGGAVIDARQGATTVNLYANSSDAIATGGTILVNAQAGTEMLALTGAASVPATITGSDGSTLWLLNQANAFIEPGAGKVLILPGSTGSATLFGGTVTFGSTTIQATPFTGSATVFGGTGFYRGGSAGHNVMVSSTLTGATTLVGGDIAAGATDFLASYGAGNLLIAGPGSAILAAMATFDTLLGGAGTNLLYSYAANNQLIAGSGAATLIAFTASDTLIAGPGSDVLIGQSTLRGGNVFITGSGSDTVLGTITGNNVVGFGSGTTLVYGQHGLSSTGPFNGNLYYQATGGGVDNIADFLPGSDVFSLSLSPDHPSLTTLTTYSAASASPFGQAGTQAILSDGTTINFRGAIVTRASFT